MRYSKLLLTAAAAGLATIAVAQDNSPPVAEPEPEEKARPGLGDLQETVDQLLREESEPVGQAQPPATPPAEPEAPPPARVEPEAPPPVQAEPVVPPASEPVPPPPPPPPARTTPPAAAQGPAPPLTREQTAALGSVIARGRLLIGLARAGMVATQDMLTRVSDPNGAGISGWIAEPAGNSEIVTFYADGTGEAGPKAVYRATVLGGRVTSREIFLGADRPALTPIQARMAAARVASENDQLRTCSTQPFNVLVVPPPSARAAVDVYRMSVPTQRGQFPLGGHYRSTVAADGNVVTHAFTNACLDVAAPQPAAGEQPRPVGVTHLADPLPTEVHMLLAQTIGRPLLVVAGDPHRVWLVTGEGIAEVRN